MVKVAFVPFLDHTWSFPLSLIHLSDLDAHAYWQHLGQKESTSTVHGAPSVATGKLHRTEVKELQMLATTLTALIGGQYQDVHGLRALDQ